MQNKKSKVCTQPIVAKWQKIMQIKSEVGLLK